MPKDPERLDRHSGTGVSGEPRKGGLKGWGKEGEQVPCESAIDKNDPNYEDPEDPSLA